MCLSTEALMLFISLIGFDLTTRHEARITVHAEMGDVHWIAREDQWCAERPERTARAEMPG